MLRCLYQVFNPVFIIKIPKKTNIHILVCIISWHHESSNYLIGFAENVLRLKKNKYTGLCNLMAPWKSQLFNNVFAENVLRLKRENKCIYHIKGLANRNLLLFFFVLGFKSLLNIPERFRTLLQISAGTVLLLQHASSGLRLLILIHIVYNQYICRSFFFIFFCFLQLVIYQLFGKLRIQGFLNLWSFFLLCFSTS